MTNTNPTEADFTWLCHIPRLELLIFFLMLFDHVFHGRLPIRVIYIVVQRLDQIEIICHKLMLLF